MVIYIAHSIPDSSVIHVLHFEGMTIIVLDIMCMVSCMMLENSCSKSRSAEFLVSGYFNCDNTYKLLILTTFIFFLLSCYILTGWRWIS